MPGVSHHREGLLGRNIRQATLILAPSPPALSTPGVGSYQSITQFVSPEHMTSVQKKSTD